MTKDKIVYHKYAAWYDTEPNFEETINKFLWNLTCLKKLTPIKISIEIRKQYIAPHCIVLSIYCVKQGQKKARDCYHSKSYPTNKLTDFLELILQSN